jgi:hypothetical protein
MYAEGRWLSKAQEEDNALPVYPKGTNAHVRVSWMRNCFILQLDMGLLDGKKWKRK